MEWISLKTLAPSLYRVLTLEGCTAVVCGPPAVRLTSSHPTAPTFYHKVSHTRVYVRMYIQMYPVTYVHTYVHTVLYVCIYIRTCAYVRVYVHVHMYVYTYVHMYYQENGMHLYTNAHIAE